MNLPPHSPLSGFVSDRLPTKQASDHENTSILRAALPLALIFALAKLLLQFALTLWTAHLGYGFFRDEFYFLMCGRHLAWGYVDQGPIVALQARLGEWLFGNSVFGIRVLSAVARALAVGLAGLLTAALGGRRPAQALAMLGLLVAPVYLAVDGFLSITSPEPIFWTGCVLALVLLQRGAPAQFAWPAIGLCAGVGLLNKPSMIFFLVALLLGLVLTPERRLLGTVWFPVAVAITLALVSPYLTWQAVHHWPTWVFLHHGEIQGKKIILSPLGFLWAQISQMEPVTALLWIPGLIALLRGSRLPRLRWIGLTYLTFLALMFRLHAKDYYLAPVYPMLFAAGAVAWERRFAYTAQVRGNRIFAFPGFELALILTGLLILPMASPVLRPSAWVRYTQALHLRPDNSESAQTSILPQFYADRFGWTEMASSVVEVVHALPPDQRRHLCILTNNYGEAASLEFLGRQLDPTLPPVISGHNNYWLWGMHGCSGGTLIAIVHDAPQDLAKRYRSVTVVGRTGTPLSMPYEHKNIYLLSGKLSPGPFDWEAEQDYI